MRGLLETSMVVVFLGCRAVVQQPVVRVLVFAAVLGGLLHRLVVLVILNLGMRLLVKIADDTEGIISTVSKTSTSVRMAGSSVREAIHRSSAGPRRSLQPNMARAHSLNA